MFPGKKMAGGSVGPVRDGRAVGGPQSAEVVALHHSLETLTDPADEGVVSAQDNKSVDTVLLKAYEGAWTSTCCPGTK